MVMDRLGWLIKVFSNTKLKVRSAFIKVQEEGTPPCPPLPDTDDFIQLGVEILPLWQAEGVPGSCHLLFGFGHNCTNLGSMVVKSELGRN